MRRHFKNWENRRQDERGATMIIVAIVMAVLMPVCITFTVELGQQVNLNRSLQSIADAGAINAANYLNGGTMTIQQAAAASVTADGNTPTTSLPADWPNVDVSASVVNGTWSAACGWNNSNCLSPKISVSAVQVVVKSNLHHLLKTGSSLLSRTAIAGVIPEAGFSIGTTLFSFSSANAASSIPVLNSLFNSFGGTVGLSAVGYNGLATTNVSLAQLISAANITALSPTTILDIGIPLAGWAKLLDAAAPGLPQSVSFGGPTAPGSCTPDDHTCFSLCQLVLINNFCSGNTLPASGLDASINLLQTLETAAQLANKNNAITLTTGLNLPGIASESLDFTAISPPTVAYGPVNTTASTSQVSLTLNLTLLGGLTSVSITVTGATGTAKLNAIDCSTGSVQDVKISGSTQATSATVAVKVLVIGLPITTQIGGAPTTQLTYDGPATGSSNVIPPSSASITGVAPAQNPQNINGLTLPTIAGLPLSIPLLTPLLSSLGIALANADIETMSATCGAVSLIQ